MLWLNFKIAANFFNTASLTGSSTTIIYAVTFDNLEKLTTQINTIYGANFDSLTLEKENNLMTN